jgi:hypothetical protein
VPNQPSRAALEADPYLHRFIVVFDREGYSPELMTRLKDKRIACLSYHKFPGDDWESHEFVAHQLLLTNGQTAIAQLAERGTQLSNGLWVRQVRKLTTTGHQTSIITTDYRADLTRLAANMFARWSQENYFKYAREHYGLDHLAGYRTQEITDPISIVNPAHRKLDGLVRSANAKLARVTAQFGALSIDAPIEPSHVEAFITKKAALQEEVQALRENVLSLKAQRKDTPRHLAVKDLPQDQQFTQLSTHSKHFVDAIKMICYRAETAMANFLRESLTRPDEARTLLRALYTTEADLVPDLQSKTLTVRLHHLAQQSSDQHIALLCDELNQTETVFPRTDLRMVFELGAPKMPSADSSKLALGSLQNP